MIDSAFFLDIIKLTIAGLIVFFVAWFVIREHLAQVAEKNIFKIKKAGLAQTLPLKIQAYERITLFLERINPSNMLPRLHVPGLSAREMQHIILSDIRSEYQHNITQQIYVSATAWNIVRKIKDETIAMVQSAVKGLPESASSGEFSKAILVHLSNLEEANPYDVAMQIVKREIEQVL